jgi:peroxiredoxin
MAETPSTMLQLGTLAPVFSLPQPVSGTTVSLSDYQDKPILIVFSCNHCPYVLHILDSFTEFANSAQHQGIGVIMISSNDVAGYPGDSPDKMAELARLKGFEFPYLYDESQQVAAAYAAACTPDFFLFDANHSLVYRGQYDGSRPGNETAINGLDMKQAVDALLSGATQSEVQTPSVGCNIKWRADN